MAGADWSDSLAARKMIEGSLAVVGGLQPSPTVAIGEIIHQWSRRQAPTAKREFGEAT